MITCRQLIEFLDQYIAGELPEQQRLEFQKHLEMCPSCVVYLKTYRRTIVLCREAIEPPPPSNPGKQASPAMPVSLVEAILKAKQEATPSQSPQNNTSEGPLS